MTTFYISAVKPGSRAARPAAVDGPSAAPFLSVWTVSQTQILCTPGNPRQATQEDILAIYKSLM